jgi:glycosyltransferase involved in cell wall biosynthesis
VSSDSFLYDLSVIAPVFNEAETVGYAVATLDASARLAVGDRYELLFLDDGSTDGTQILLRRLAAENAHVRVLGDGRHHGYGAMVGEGIGLAQGEYVLLTDGDGQFSCEELAEVWPRRHEYGLILGYRKERKEGWKRRLGTFLLRGLTRVFLGIGMRDIDCSFKLAQAGWLRSLDLRCKGFGIDTEIVQGILKERGQILEIPVKHNSRLGGKSKLTFGRLIVSFFEFAVLSVQKCWKG